jgi:hypothetical protein
VTTPSDAAVAAVEAGMLDTCTITAPGTLGAYDPDTLTHAQVAGAAVYSGACQVAEAGRGTTGGMRTRGNEPEVEHPYQVSIPRAETGVRPGHHLNVTAVHDDGDPDLLTKTFVIRRVRYSTRAARRILLCDLLEGAAT